jgi:hypothetical protein
MSKESKEKAFSGGVGVWGWDGNPFPRRMEIVFRHCVPRPRLMCACKKLGRIDNTAAL